MTPHFATRRFHELQKRLERRNNSLKPSDYFFINNSNNRIGGTSSSKRSSHLFTTNANNNVQHTFLLLEHPSTDRPSPNQKEGIPSTPKVYQESQENTPKLANTRKEEQEEEQLLFLTKTLAVKTTHLASTTSETVGAALRRIKQMRESGYLPVAASSRRVLTNTHHNSNNNNSNNNNNNNVNHQVVEDAEQEYRNLFRAPSSIEVHQKSTFDEDGVTEVSEITTTDNIRARSLRGASYAERRMAGKLQKMREQNFLVVQPANKHLGTTQKQFQQQQQPKQKQHQDDHMDLEKSSSYVEGEACDLKHLIQRVERAKLDLQQSESHGNSIVRRHGLPYEMTDYRAEGEEEDEEEEEGSVECWDNVIRGVHPRIPSPQRQALDPADGEVICVQGPPTPTRNCPSADNIRNLIRETISSEGDVVIDATEIRDEDLDGISVHIDVKQPPTKGDERTVGTSVLVGEEIIDAEYPKMVSSHTGGSKPKVKRDCTEEWLASVDVGVGVPETSATDEKASAATTASSASNQPNYDSESTSGSFDDPDVSSLLVQAEARSEKRDNFASDIYQSGVGFFKSVKAQVDTQLKFIQNGGLISENDMDEMLGILQKDISEATVRIPKESDDMVVFFGDELEKNTCGVPQVLPVLPTGGVTSYQHDSVESMLDSLKTSYKTSFLQCGVDPNLIKENTKAIEDMMAQLKQSCGNDTPVCGRSQNDVDAAVPDERNNTMEQKAKTLLNRAVLSQKSKGEKDKPLVTSGRATTVTSAAPTAAKNDKTPPKDPSSQSVSEILKKARETVEKNRIRISKYKQKRIKTASPEPQTFIVPINMFNSRRNKNTQGAKSGNDDAKGYSAIE